MRIRFITSVFFVFIALSSELGAQLLKLDYSTYLGGSAVDAGYAVATDPGGNVYLAGFTQSSDFPVLNGLQPYFGGGTGDLFVAKLKADASAYEYISYLGGSGGEGDPGGHVGGIAIDAQGNVYIAGITRSPDFPTTPGAIQSAIASQFVCDDDPNAGLCGDAFVLKLNPQGKLVYSTFLGGSDYDDAKAIAVDAAGCVYVTGITASPDFPTTSGAFQPVLHDVDAYVAKLSADGSTLIYSTLLGGTGLDAGMAIAIDNQGRAYIAGTTQAADFPLKNAWQKQYGDPWDAFVARLNATGTDLDFSTFFGGSGTDEAFAIALDATGNIYVAGFTDSPDFPIVNAFQPDYGGGEGNGFVAKLRGDGSSIVYATFLGGTDGRSEITAIAVDKSGSAIVAGQGGSDFPIINPLQPYGGSSDAIVAKFTPDGFGLLYSTFVGGSDTDVANAVAVDRFEKIVLAGQTSSANFAITPNAAQSQLAGSSDAFLLRLLENPAALAIFSSPKQIGVGPVYVGQSSAAKSLRITNPGTQVLHVRSIVTSPNVSVTSDCEAIAPAANCNLAATLSASTLGDQTGTIAFFDDAPDSPQTIFVHGEGVTGGDLELAQVVTGSRFTFYGRTAIPFTATIVNHGPNDSESVELVVVSDSGSFDCNPCYLGHLGAGKSAVLRFNFLPTRYGMLSVNASLETSAQTPDLNSRNDSLALSVANPRYRIDPPQLVFSNQVVGLSSPSQRITLTSLDGNPLHLSLATTGDFTSTISCDPNWLRCFADVTFSPKIAGTQSAALIVTEASAGTVDSIALSGSAILAPHVHLSTSSLKLDQSMQSGWSVPQFVTIMNDGSAPLFIVSISATSSFSQTSDCPPSLNPGASCKVAVQFMPAMPGSCSGSLTVVSNTAGLLDVVNLNGNGIPVANLVRPSRPSPVTATTSSSSSKTSGRVTAVVVKPRPSRPAAHPLVVKTKLAR